MSQTWFQAIYSTYLPLLLGAVTCCKFFTSESIPTSEASKRPKAAFSTATFIPASLKAKRTGSPCQSCCNNSCNVTTETKREGQQEQQKGWPLTKKSDEVVKSLYKGMVLLFW